MNYNKGREEDDSISSTVYASQTSKMLSKIRELNNEVKCLKEQLAVERSISKEFERQIIEAKKILTGTLPPNFLSPVTAEVANEGEKKQ